MKFFNYFLRLYSRIQYPVSLPEEIASALGIRATNDLAFDDFIRLLTSPACLPTRLRKYMRREDAEAAFDTAIKKERFSRHSLFSYYFNNGWMGFYLQFDQESKLRRIYVQHKVLKKQDGVEIDLAKRSFSYNR